MSWPWKVKSPQENSSLLKSADLKGIAQYMQSDACKNVFLMLGAGVSTAAGIPDFRSPETGLYANLARLKLPYPEAVFQIDFFRRNPVPFYTLAKELYPGRYRPTLTHSFIKLLHKHSMLHTCFTQNIDTLERRAGVPSKKIIEAHGSFATQRCIDCKREFDGDKMKKVVADASIPRCEKCKGLVKPDIVFFGEALPTEFHTSIPSLRRADLLIVMGTSLTVHPFASLTELVPDNCPRVLINMDEVGHFDRDTDVVCLGKCDEMVRELCRELGWEKELDIEWAATIDSVEVEKVAEETVDEEVNKIAKDMEESLTVSNAETAKEKGLVEEKETQPANAAAEVVVKAESVDAGEQTQPASPDGKL